jgi:small subunit ribosomal protein S2
MSQKIEYKDLLNAGVHFGHLTRKWDPKMAPYIFMERNGIHIIDLNKTLVSLGQATEYIKNLVKNNRKILFVATKKQAKELVAAEAARLKMPYVTERWLGGMLTNYATVRKSLKKLQSLEKIQKDEAMLKNLAKKERLMLGREKEKLQRVLGGITEMKNLPAAIFVVDIRKEHIAIEEAHKLGIPVIAMCDTNSDPTSVEFPIPANDDAFKSIAIITQAIGAAIEEGYFERRSRNEDEEEIEATMIANEAPAVVAPVAEVAAPVAVEAPAQVAEVAAPVEETPVVEAEAPAEEVAAPVEETPVAEAEAPAEEAPAAEDENKTAE